MAQQIGIIKLTGTIGDITCYKKGNKYFAKQKSSLSGERVKKGQEFWRTRINNDFFGWGSKVASFVYHQLHKDFQVLRVFNSFCVEAADLLRNGKTMDEAKDILVNIYINGGRREKPQSSGNNTIKGEAPENKIINSSKPATKKVEKLGKTLFVTPDGSCFGHPASANTINAAVAALHAFPQQIKPVTDSNSKRPTKKLAQLNKGKRRLQRNNLEFSRRHGPPG